MEAAVKEASAIQGCVTRVLSRDVLTPSDEALVEPCVRQLQHQFSHFQKRNLNVRGLRRGAWLFQSSEGETSKH